MRYFNYERYFAEATHLLDYVAQHPEILKWRYDFTFANGYELIVEEVANHE